MAQEFVTTEQFQELRDAHNDLIDRLNDLNLKRVEDFSDLRVEESDDSEDDSFDEEEISI